MRSLEIWLVLSLVVLVAAACGDEVDAGTSAPRSSSAAAPASPTDGTETPPTDQGAEVDAFLAACSAAASAEAGNLAAAEATLHDEVHEPLHALADQTRAVAPATAADLLQAKYRVEADLEQAEPDARSLLLDLEALLDAMTDALVELDITAPPCPEQPT